MAHNIMESIEILSSSVKAFTLDCIKDIKVDKEKCESYIEDSLAMCTSLAPIIGYNNAANVAKKAYKNGKTVRQVVNEDKILDKSKSDKILDPKTMVKPSL